MSYKCLLLLINFIYILTSEYPYIVNPDGLDCSKSPATPISEEDCTQYHGEEMACCFVSIKLDSGTVNKCVKVDRRHRFALDHLGKVDIAGYTDVQAEFKCGQKMRFCGMSNPDKDYKCREHSSEQKTCCRLEYPGGEECILSQEKWEETTFTMFGKNKIYCTGWNLRVKLSWIFIWMIMYSLL